MSDVNSVPTSSQPSLVKTNDPIERLAENEWKIFLSLADTFIPPVKPQDLRPYVSTNKYSASSDELVQYAAMSPSTMGDIFLNSLKATLAQAPPNIKAKFGLIVKLLSHRSTAIIFTKSTYLLTEMPLSQREQVLLSWYNSRLTPLRDLFRSFYILTYITFVRINPLGYKVMGHPEFDPHRHDSERTNREFFRYDILDMGRYATTAEIDVDVVIVGSGSGGGVVAHNLSQIDGISILVIEKGKYYHQSELNLNEDQGFAKLYDHGATIISDDGSMTVLAANTLGGGSTVNWSASIRTPDNARKEWAETVPWYGEKVFDDAMDHVMHQMGCSTEHVKHSFSNNVIFEGSSKLGYDSHVISQNTGGYEHQCGFCAYGCKYGEKQGGVVNWLRQAVERGNTKVITETDVLRVTRQGSKASGVDAVVHQHGKDIPLRVKAKKVVVAGGALHSPGLLLRSGFKNKNIGKNLKMHPLTTMYGRFPDKELNGFEDTIMSAVCNEETDIDGKGHGPRIETMIHQPLHTMAFYPWRSGKEWRQLQASYNHLAALLVIQRDIGSGRVHYTNDMAFRPRVDYTVGKADLAGIAEGLGTASDLLYIQGAEELIAPAPWIPIFKATVPLEKRSISDPDYHKWVTNLRNTTLEPLRNHFASAHQMSSCRIGNDPKVSVANDRGQLWECDNVYIADGSVLPSASGVNPMITIMASSHVISGYIAEDLARTLGSKL